MRPADGTGWAGQATDDTGRPTGGTDGTGQPADGGGQAMPPGGLVSSVVLSDVVREVTGRVLAREPHEIAGELPFEAQGLDPLRAIHLVRALNEALSLDLPTTVAFDFPTPDHLTAHLLTRYADATPRTAPARLAPGHPARDLTEPRNPASELPAPGHPAPERPPAPAAAPEPPASAAPLASTAPPGPTQPLTTAQPPGPTPLPGPAQLPGPHPSVPAPPLPPVRWNLAQGQLVMYRDQRRCPGSVAYNLPLLFEIHGELDEAALERAVRAQVETHPVLGARFGERDGVPYMTVVPGRGPSFGRVTLTGESRAEQLAELRALVDVPFDLAAGPLVRAHLVTLPGGRRLLLLTVHHILMDGTSTAVLIRTLKEAYRGERAQPGVSFGDFVAWEEELLAGARGARHREHWLRRLAGSPPLALPFDRPYDPRRLPRVAVLTAGVPPARAAALAATARAHRVSVATVFFAAYVRLLRRLTGQGDLILGMTVAARYEKRFQDVVGQIANCLPLRCADTGDLAGLLRSAQREMVAGIEHGACPLPEIARSLGTGGPLVLTNFLFQNFEGAELLGDGVRSGPGALDLRPFDDLPYAGEYPLSLEFYRDGEGYKVFLKYDTHVFDESTARKALTEWNAVLDEFTPDIPGIPGGNDGRSA
ncbi:hypothetical protein IAG44_17810 [Streptomyces roseirectus]|uniref:Carrier domain-containing protein n=1 Tax=Streptomyces roseirectus TaxID=2768066 RepID=A0A7H0IE95_9ACTN|nr:condensation domain-containing protein [Streptomyces roseirectus]QNP71111.1 hypothetical protein IAG44_17810 [Streptomyces roseirectus]